jgi:hypothetical protein
MQEILVDGGELVLQHLVEERDGDRIAGDAGMGLWPRRYSAASARASRLWSSIFSIVSWHRPQFFLTPQRAYTSSAQAAPLQIAAPMRCSFSLLQTQTIIQQVPWRGSVRPQHFLSCE